jgi:lysyl-tRNA synthetase class 2
MFEEVKRKLYLEKFWIAYPAVYHSDQLEFRTICGRLLALSAKPGNAIAPSNFGESRNVGEPRSAELYFATNPIEYKKNLHPKYPKVSEDSAVSEIINLKTFSWFNKSSDLNSEIRLFQCGEDSLPAPHEVLKAGDWVQIIGRQIHLLAPCWSENYFAISQLELYRKWISFLNEVQIFFKQNGFDEIKTPSLVVCPGTEPFLEPFVTEFNFGKVNQKLFLPTSPELSLKKCLARGWGNIFEIRPCFRNGEVSHQHRSEFYMLEWYRSFHTLESIKTDIFSLLDFLKFSDWQLNQLKTLTIAELFEKHLNFQLQPNTTTKELFDLAKTFNLEIDDQWDFDDIFFLLYVEKIESNLTEYKYLILEKYPPSQAALARLTPDGWGDRFEFYINGIEIANAFHELNDPKLQRQRFIEDLEKKRKLNKTEVPVDEAFLEHLWQGMPPSAGIALGLERLFMALNNINDISQISPY